ncbi:unnamed protein product, partial [Hapterophycus canaliculatus]
RSQTAEPLLRAVQEDNARHIATHRGEVAAIVQYVYSLSASRLQPFIRGALTRRRLPDALREMFSYAFLCAAVEIQRVFRGCIARRRRQKALVSLASLVCLQARIRGVLLRQRVAKKWDALLDRQASEIQRVFRGHLSRGAANAALKEKTRAQSANLQGWASLILQTQARVWLARRIVHLKRVEVGLTARVSEIADKLASSDDSRTVSAVLGQIDNDYRKYERIIGDFKAREEEMATTFVEKVLERRDADVAGAWTRFIGAVTKFGTDRMERSETRRAHIHPVTRGEEATACEIQDRKLFLLMERYGIPAHARTLPSAYLRAALPMHLKLHGGSLAAGVASHAQLPAAGVKSLTAGQKRQHMDSLDMSFGDLASSRLKKSGTSVPHVQRSVINMVAEGSFKSSITSVGGGPSTRSTTRTTPIGGQHLGSVGSSSGRWPSKADGDDLGSGHGGGESSDSELRNDSVGDQTHTCNDAGADGAERCVANSRGENTGSTTSSRWEHTWDTERTSRGLAGDAGSRFPGSSARQDMPSGMKEVVERLCAAAFLRGHVPDGLMPKGTTPEDAYQRYLNLPPSLAKIRHEQLCTEASRPVASALRSFGYTTLEHLLPVSKLEHLLHQAGAGVDESLAAISLAREIKRRHDISGGSDGSDRGLFSPLSPFSRRGLAGSRRTPDSKEASHRNTRCGGRDANTGTTSRGKTRSGTAGGEGLLEPKQKITPLRISLGGLESGSTAPGTEKGDGKWDPSRYTTRPEEWIRPPPSVIKRRWDESAKAFVPVNNYRFDELYRRHHQLDPRHHRDDDQFDDERNNSTRDDDVSTWRVEDERNGDMQQASSVVRARGDSPSTPVPNSLSGSVNRGDSYAKRMADIMREDYGTFFDGMAQSARELYQFITNDSASWGRVEDPIGTLLCRAAFHVVEHPSPPTKAELALAFERYLASKGLGGRRNNLARPIALAGKFNDSGLEKELAQAALACEHVPMGPAAFREFVGQLDATSGNRSSSSTPSTLNTARTGRLYGAAPVDPCRTLMERRLQAAATLANPFKVRLEADGVSDVRGLARIPARAWGLPPCLVEEIERMLGVLVARTCALEHFRAHGGPKRDRVPDENTKPKRGDSSRKSALVRGVPRRQDKNPGGARRLQQQSFEFDPRFQRSPLDPFGRPGRLERIRPCLGARQETDGGRRPDGCQLSTDEDDLPPGMWELATAAEDPIRSDVVETSGSEREMEEAIDASLLSVPVESMVLGAQSDLRAEDLPVDSRAAQEPVGHRKPRSQPEQAQKPSHPTAKRRLVSDGKKNSSPATEGARPSSTRFTCRVLPRCKAVFSRASVLGTHERSHASAPEYHRLRRAPQLFRDRPPAPSEGAGAAAVKFRLRTTLPPSIRRELELLEGEEALGTHRDLQARSDLPGAVAM